MIKSKLFIDMDGVLVHSTKQFCRAYNILYKDHPDFKFADYTKVNKYSFKDQCKLIDNPLTIFEDDLFFTNLEFINDNTYEILKRLQEKYQLIIVTIGTPLNLAKKALYLAHKLPFINDYVLLKNNRCVMDKSIVNMSGEGNYFIDDMPSNLESSNCENKILFGKIYSWNKDGLDKFEHCLSWDDVRERLL